MIVLVSLIASGPRFVGWGRSWEGWGVRACLADESLLAHGADVVVECTGSPQGFASARRLLRPRGALVLKSTYHDALSVDMSGLVVDEITLLGSRCGPFAPALRLMASGLVGPRTLISETFTLDQSEPAFARAASPGVLKVLLAP
ncbi:MAG: hypothetical protein E4H22_03380 [Solirubrobacterales bacterium]|nr:MAG: hypothetical protein E4H22_03380 [Solirubrobacterales bacterium]